MPDIRIVDLDVIKRYSLAIRQETAPAEEVLASLDASREIVLAALGRTRGGKGAPPPVDADDGDGDDGDDEDVPRRRPAASGARKAAGGAKKAAGATKKTASRPTGSARRT